MLINKQLDLNITSFSTLNIYMDWKMFVYGWRKAFRYLWLFHVPYITIPFIGFSQFASGCVLKGAFDILYEHELYLQAISPSKMIRQFLLRMRALNNILLFQVYQIQLHFSTMFHIKYKTQRLELFYIYFKETLVVDFVASSHFTLTFISHHIKHYK